MAASKPQFKRQESWRYLRVKDAWRRPRGGTSRMRKEKAGWPARVKVGHGTSKATRTLHPSGLVERLVVRELDLQGLDAKRHIVRFSRRLGERKRRVFLEKIRELNVRVANPGKEEARPTEAAEAGLAAQPADNREPAETTVDRIPPAEIRETPEEEQ